MACCCLKASYSPSFCIRFCTLKAVRRAGRYASLQALACSVSQALAVWRTCQLFSRAGPCGATSSWRHEVAINQSSRLTSNTRYACPALPNCALQVTDPLLESRGESAAAYVIAAVLFGAGVWAIMGEQKGQGAGLCLLFPLFSSIFLMMQSPLWHFCV